MSEVEVVKPVFANKILKIGIIFFALFLLFTFSTDAFAADRYWVGGDGTWNTTDTTHWASSSGGAGGASVPSSSDNCIFDTLSQNTGDNAYTVTLSTATVSCLDFTMDGPGSGNNITWAGSTGLDIYGSMNLIGGSTDITRSYTGTITFKATSTGKTITMNGVTFAGSITFNGAGGGWTLQDALTNTSSMTLTTGTLDTNGQTVSISSLGISGSSTRTLTLGSSSFSITGTVGAFNAGSLTNMTFNANTSTVTFSGVSNFISVSSGGLTFNNVVFSGTGNKSVSGANTFANLTVTGTAAKTGTLAFSGNQIVTGTFTVNGNSVTDRVLIQSNTIGTARTITAAAVSLTNADFTDITGAGAAAPFAGTSIGNCLGNTNITETTPTTRYWVASGSASWSSTSSWSASDGGASGASVPLCHDTVTFTSNSGSGTRTITEDMPRLGADIDFSAISAGAVTLTNSTANTIYGSLILASNTTPSGTNTTTLASRSSEVLTSAGRTFTQAIIIYAPGGAYTMQDDFTDSLGNGTVPLTITEGTFDANDHNVTLSGALASFNSSNSNTRTIYMGSGTWTMAGCQGTGWTFSTSTNLTLYSETSTIKFTCTNAQNMLFAGGSQTFYNIWWSRGSSTANIAVSGSNTFNDFKDDGSGNHNLLFVAGTTQTVNTFTVSGSATNTITINSSGGTQDTTSTSTHALVKSGGGVINSDYLNIQHSVATPSSTWYAGTHSTNNQATATAGSGWTFTAAPAVCTATSTGTWGGTDTANFTGCTGAASGGSGTGARPGNGDHVLVSSGVTVTLDANTASTLEDLVIDGTLDTSASNYSITTKRIVISSGGTLTANASTITISGTDGVLFTQTGTFTYGTSTVVMNGDGAFTSPNFLTSSSATGFYNLTFSPTLSAARTYTFGTGAVTVNGAFNSNPSGGGSARALTTILGSGGLTVVGAITLQGTSSGTSTLDTGNGLNYTLRFGSIDITSGDTITSRNSTVYATGTSGTLITNNGTYTVSSSNTLNLSGNGDATILSGSTVDLTNLVVSGTGTKTMGVSFSTGTLTISAGTFALGSRTITLTGTNGNPFAAVAGAFDAGTGTVSYTGANASGNTTIQTSGVTYYNLSLNLSGETINPNGTLNGSASGTLTLTLGTLDTTSANNYAINFGAISIANSGGAILTANASVITLNATSGTLFTRGASGVFTQGTSEVAVTSASGTPTFLSGATTFHKLTINSAATVINQGSAVTIADASGSKLYVQSGVFNDMGIGIATSGSTNNTLQIDSGGTLCLGGSTTASTNATCNSSAVSTTARAMPSFATYTFDASSTVVYLSDAATTISNTPTYGNLKLTPLFVTTSRTYTLGGAMTINGNFTITPDESGASTPALTVNPGGTITVASGKTTTISRANSATATLDLNVSAVDYNLSTGLLDIGTGGTLDATSSASTITLTGTSGTLFTKTGTFTITSGTPTVSVTSASGTPTLLSAATTFYNLTINSGATVINQGAFAPTINNNLTITSGVFNASGASITGPGAGAGTLTIGATGTLCLGGTTASTNASCNSGATDTTTRAMPTFQTYTFDTASTVEYLADANTTVSHTPTYGNLYIMPSTIGAERHYTPSGALTINGNFYINPDLSDGENFYFDAGGNVTVASSKTTIITSSDGVATTYFDLRPSSTDYNFSTGLLDIAATGYLDASSSASTITLSGTSGPVWTQNGLFVITSGTPTVTISGNGTFTFNTGSVAPTFYNLTSSGTGTKTFGSNITVNNVFTISAGTIDASSRTLTLAGTTGTPFVNSGTFTPSTGTVSYTGNNSGGNTTITNTTYNNLTVNNASETYVLGADITIPGTLTVTAGTFSPGSYTINLSGTGTVLSNSGTFSGASSIINITDTSASAKTFGGGGGTFGTVNFIPANGGGSYTISGSNTFASFNDTGNSTHTINFTAGTTQTVAVWNVKGSSGNIITLQSTSNGSTWYLVPSPGSVGAGRFESDYLSIRDSTATNGWVYKKTLVIDNAVVSNTDQTDFPLLVYFASDADLAAHAQADGDDIKFTDSLGNQLDHEISIFNSSTGQLEAWVRIPTLSASTDTTLYMYYGNAGASNQQDATGTWDTNFEGIWHFGNGTSLSAEDSTNVNDGTVVGSPTATTGKVGGGVNSFSANNYINLANTSSLNITGSITISSWINMSATNTLSVLFGGYQNSGSYPGYGFGVSVPTASTRSVSYYTVGTGWKNSNSSVLSDNTWHYISVTDNGTTRTFYVDGVAQGTATAGNPNSYAGTRVIGATETHTAAFPGKADELRISSSARSADWLKTEYNNQNSPATYQTLSDETIVGNFVGIYAGASSTSVSNNAGWIFETISRGGGGGGVEASATPDASVGGGGQGGGPGGEYIAYPTDDAYVDSAHSTTNYGSSTFMAIGGWGNILLFGVKFDITSLPANNVQSAIVHAYISSGQASQLTSTKWNRIDSSWAEDTVTYQSRPTGMTNNTGTEVAIPSPSGWATFDITTLYNQWKAGTYTNYGIALTGNAASYNAAATNFVSKEGTSSLRPYLEIITTDGVEGGAVDDGDVGGGSQGGGAGGLE